MITGHSWSTLDWFVVIIYLLAGFGVGFYFKKFNKSTDDYFLGGGRVPAIVSALSIYATLLSSISFIAIPASIFKNGLVVGVASLGTMILSFLVAIYIVPLFRRLDVVTGYEYLERRFGYGFKLISSLSFIGFHVIRIAIVLFLPALAIQAVMPGSSTILIVILTGLICVGYTTIAGIEGVAWSDAFQSVVLMIGALIIMFVGFQYIPEQGLFAALSEQGKGFTAKNFEFSLSGDSFWSVVIGHGIIGSIYGYIGSQDILQRYKITATLKEARKSIYYNIPLLAISVVIFVGMGAALVVFFNYSPYALNLDALGGNNNALLPYFVVNYLPMGVSGLVIVGILAAAQSTVSSSINAVATCLTNDIMFGTKAGRLVADAKKLSFARYASMVVGVIGTFLAYWFIVNGQGDAFKMFAAVTGLVGGPIAAIFILGFFAKRVGANAAWIGLAISLFVAFYISNPFGLPYTKPDVNAFLVAPVVLLCGIIPALLASLFFKAPTAEEIDGLTYATAMDKPEVIIGAKK